MRNPVALALVMATSFAIGACSPATGGLTGKTWQWTALTTKNPVSQSVVPADVQAVYTIEFKSDGTFAAKADCNQLAGTYTAASAGALTITPGPSTLVACPEGSLAPIYVAVLATAANYAIDAGVLTIRTTDEAAMTFK